MRSTIKIPQIFRGWTRSSNVLEKHRTHSLVMRKRLHWLLLYSSKWTKPFLVWQFSEFCFAQYILWRIAKPHRWTDPGPTYSNNKSNLNGRKDGDWGCLSRSRGSWKYRGLGPGNWCTFCLSSQGHKGNDHCCVKELFWCESEGRMYWDLGFVVRSVRNCRSLIDREILGN